jgi:hypothetical protein
MLKMIRSLNTFHFAEFVDCYRWTKCHGIHCKKSRDRFNDIVKPIRFLPDSDQFIESGLTDEGILNSGLEIYILQTSKLLEGTGRIARPVR